jgi:hypothetical protein
MVRGPVVDADRYWTAVEEVAMSIELHCPQCQKLIRAPDDAGGKTGKCPFCKASVYIPTPPSAEEEEIRIAPVDEEDIRREEQLRREAIQYAASVDHATDPGADVGGGKGHAPIPDIDYGSEVELYIRSMHQSKLGDAEAAVARIKRGGTKAYDYVERLLLDEIAPEFEGVPPGLVKGFLKRLVGQLG